MGSPLMLMSIVIVYKCEVKKERPNACLRSIGCKTRHNLLDLLVREAPLDRPWLSARKRRIRTNHGGPRLLRTKSTVHPKHRASVDKIEEWLLLSLLKGSLKCLGTMRSRPFQSTIPCPFPFWRGVGGALEGGKHACMQLPYSRYADNMWSACARALTDDLAFPFADKALTAPQLTYHFCVLFRLGLQDVVSCTPRIYESAATEGP
jgi:hypothetical protein